MKTIAVGIILALAITLGPLQAIGTLAHLTLGAAGATGLVLAVKEGSRREARE